MALTKELGLTKPITVPAHEAILNIYYTASCLKKRADGFFRQFGLTDVQFNLMMLLCYQSDPGEGISQAQLSEMMLVNRANITSLVDRMEKAELVVRTEATDDRRYNIVKLTSQGKRLLAKVEPLYAKQVRDIMAALKETEQRRLTIMLEKIRASLTGRK